VTVVRSRVETVWFARLVWLVRSVPIVGMTEFLPDLPIDDLNVLNDHYHIIRGPAEMLADGLAILC
jgi:hypothetical protein